MSRGIYARCGPPSFLCHRGSDGSWVGVRSRDRTGPREVRHERCQVGRHWEAFSDSASEPTPIRASVAMTGTKCHMRSMAQEVPLGEAPHLEERSGTSRVPTTRPDNGLPLPTGKLLNSPRVFTVCDPALARARLREIDHRSSGDGAVLDKVPQGNQQFSGNGYDSFAAQA